MPGESIKKTQDANPRRFVLAIDLGSGGPKAALVADTGEVVATAQEKTTTYLLPEGGAEQDAQEWWQGAKQTAKKVIAESGVTAGEIIAVAVDSMWSVVVPVDVHGEPLMRAVHWMDVRGGPHNRKIIKGFPSIQGYGLFKLLKWIRSTGLAPTHSGVDSFGHVLYIKNERPEIYAKTHKFLEPMDYLTSRLTGRITATQKTMTIFMVTDNRRWGGLKYNEGLLKLAGVEKEKFPELVANDGIVGSLDPAVARELGLLPSTQVVAGIGDSNASAIGSGAVHDYEAIIYIGTSYYMNCHVPFKKTDLFHMMASLPSPFPSKYLMFAEQGTGGRCVEYFLNDFVYADDAFNTGTRPEDAYDRFNACAAEAPAGSGGVIFLPWLNGSITPHENPFARGGFINISLKTRRSHLARAVMEGLAYNNRWVKGAAEKFIGRPIGSFRFSGGGALSDLWSQIQADILGVPIQQIDDPLNSTVRGTALLAFIALGHRTISEIPGLVRIKRVFEPEEGHRPIYDKMYSQYRALFRKNKGIFAALNADEI
ncbi:MAG: FGGY-family carbohydrate kinase [Deltaproteobacteria bacterium]|nr:FGGY-family carbohydrate kinase [Deltaproteobacteria bacterium]